MLLYVIQCKPSEGICSKIVVEKLTFQVNHQFKNARITDHHFIHILFRQQNDIHLYITQLKTGVRIRNTHKMYPGLEKMANPINYDYFTSVKLHKHCAKGE